MNPATDIRRRAIALIKPYLHSSDRTNQANTVVSNRPRHQGFAIAY
ncbi:hypothetical protein [Nostoc sp. UHCC 0870]